MSIKLLAATSVLIAGLFAGAAAQASVIVESNSFITKPTEFNGFEAMTGYSYSANKLYTEDGINVEYMGSANLFIGSLGQGVHAWYPNGGGTGYTKLSLADGGDFQNVQFWASSGFGQNFWIDYRLMENGQVVATGNIARNSASNAFSGFSGLGFDEVDLQATYGNQPFSTSSYEGLMLDSISVERHAVPEPGSVALLGLGLVGVLARRKSGARKNG